MVTSRRRTSPLTRDELFETALRLVDEEGIDALTMRRLGDEVGVEAASLYHHVPNKEALIDGVLVRMRSEVRLPTPLPTDWIEIFEVIFAEYRRVLTAHPNLMSYAGRRVESDPETSGLQSLTEMGFSQDDAVDLWQSLIAFSVGFSVFGSSAAETDTSDLPSDLALRMVQWRDETFSRTLRMILKGYAACVGARGLVARPGPPTS
jgi:TetR/AcrR family tetracycline transcriptional repressor